MKHDRQQQDHPDEEDRLKKTLDCRKVADWLQLDGVGPARICPRCGSKQNGQISPTIALGQDMFECYCCGWHGDPVDMVKFVRACTEREALTWLEKQLTLAMRASGPVTVPDRHHEIREAYLAGCRPVSDTLASLLRQWGIYEEQVGRFGIRYYAKDNDQLMRRLQERYGQSLLLDTGLSRPDASSNLGSTVFVEGLASAADSAVSPVGGGQQNVGSAFEAYDAAKVPYLLLPYRLDGRIAYIKARPLMDTQKLARLKLPLSLATGEIMPCLFNVDALKTHERVLLLRRELDAIACEARGLPAVACSSLSNFRPEWAQRFWNRTVALVLDSQKADDPRIAKIDAMFDAAGVGRPKRLVVPPGQDPARFAHERLGGLSGQGWQTLPTSRPQSPVGGLGSKQDGQGRSSLSLSESHPAEDLGETESEQFIAVIPSGEDRAVVLHRVVKGGQNCVQMRAWIKRRNQWLPEGDHQMIFPVSLVTEVIGSLVSASKSQPMGDRPDWLTIA